jgi:hypothetical protein
LLGLASLAAIPFLVITYVESLLLAPEFEAVIRPENRGATRSTLATRYSSKSRFR